MTKIRYATAADMKAIRGLRNNNPLNIKHNVGNNWVGQADEQPDPTFVSFRSLEYGIRAGVIILMNYWDKHNLRTVNEIISRWAPKIENNVNSYVSTVCAITNWTPSTVVNVYDPDMLFKLLDAMIVVECGVRLPASVIRDGMALAGPRRKPKLSEVPETNSGRMAIGVGGALTVGTSIITAAAEQVDDLSLTTKLAVFVALGVAVIITAIVWRAQRE